jgi:hypothetical protein
MSGLCQLKEAANEERFDSTTVDSRVMAVSPAKPDGEGNECIS